MRKYIIVRNTDRPGHCHVEIHKYIGQEEGIPCYEHYRTMKNFPEAADLIRRLEAA
jgi:hypothetical protein